MDKRTASKLIVMAVVLALEDHEFALDEKSRGGDKDYQRLCEAETAMANELRRRHALQERSAHSASEKPGQK